MVVYSQNGVKYSQNKINTVIDNGLVGWLSGKESAYDEEDAEGTWGGKIPWRRAWQPLQYSYMQHPMYRGAWQAPLGWVHWVAKCRT